MLAAQTSLSPPAGIDMGCEGVTASPRTASQCRGHPVLPGPSDASRVLLTHPSPCSSCVPPTSETAPGWEPGDAVTGLGTAPEHTQPGQGTAQPRGQGTARRAGQGKGEWGERPAAPARGAAGPPSAGAEQSEAAGLGRSRQRTRPGRFPVTPRCPRAHQPQVAGRPVPVQHGPLRPAVAQPQGLRVGSEGRGVVPRLEQRVAPSPQLLRCHL